MASAICHLPTTFLPTMHMPLAGTSSPPHPTTTCHPSPSLPPHLSHPLPLRQFQIMEFQVSEFGQFVGLVLPLPLWFVFIPFHYLLLPPISLHAVIASSAGRQAGVSLKPHLLLLPYAVLPRSLPTTAAFLTHLRHTAAPCTALSAILTAALHSAIPLYIHYGMP